MPSVATLLDLHVGDKNPGELRSPWAAGGGCPSRSLAGPPGVSHGGNFSDATS